MAPTSDPATDVATANTAPEEEKDVPVEEDKEAQEAALARKQEEEARRPPEPPPLPKIVRDRVACYLCGPSSTFHGIVVSFTMDMDNTKIEMLIEAGTSLSYQGTDTKDLSNFACRIPSTDGDGIPGIMQRFAQRLFGGNFAMMRASLLVLPRPTITAGNAESIRKGLVFASAATHGGLTFRSVGVVDSSAQALDTQENAFLEQLRARFPEADLPNEKSLTEWQRRGLGYIVRCLEMAKTAKGEHFRVTEIRMKTPISILVLAKEDQ
jgi:hypothetical protein